MSPRPPCDEDGCTNEASAVCFNCALFLCSQHATVDGDCDQCFAPMNPA